MELVVGLFMIAGIVCLLFLAFKVSGLTSWSYANTYKITAAFQNIGDLKVRAPVTIAGVRIGLLTLTWSLGLAYLPRQRGSS